MADLTLAEALAQGLARWREWMPLGGAVVAGAWLAQAVANRIPPRWSRTVFVLLGLTLGLALVLARASVVDDAYISFRYARHLAEGRGLVWNDGERVEGYTNFLWTVLLAGLSKVSGLAVPYWGLWGSVVSWAANVVVIERIARRVLGGTLSVLPVAALLAAVHPLLVSIGTTGLETAFAVLLLDLALLALVMEERPGRMALAGLAFALGVLCRPDHLLFYVAGGAALVVDLGLTARARGDGPRTVLAAAWSPVLGFAAPLGLVVLHQGFRLLYYGDVAPNTWYAKSADQAWWSQGLMYAGTVWIGGLAAVLLLPGLAGAVVLARGAGRRFGLFVLIATPLFLTYVTRVGGDFMWGRFYAALLPPLFIAVEAATLRGGPRLRACTLALAAVALVPLPGFPPSRPVAGIIDESAVYRVEEFWPLRIDHRSQRSGEALARLREAGVRPVLATGGIGLVGYHSDLPLIDLRGLTDRIIAANPVRRRGRPGHEKEPPPGYLAERGVQLVRRRGPGLAFHPKAFQPITIVDLGLGKSGDEWQLAQWDPALVAALESAPGVRLPPFRAWLDRFVAQRSARPAEEVEEGLRWLRTFYFPWNDDPRFSAEDRQPDR